jgi:triosephosphate isomerase
VLNLKVYPSALGDRALALGRLLADRAAAVGVACAIAPSAPDIGALTRKLSIPVLAQHADALAPGARTGFVLPEALRAAGARGSLVNHSEHPLSSAAVGELLERLRANRLAAVVCARDTRVAARLAGFAPEYIAVEPPELIGGKVSVATARPELIERTVRAVHARSPGTVVLCGAGVHDREDISVARRLGAEGVLVASAVATAKDPAAALDELFAGF